MSTQRNRDLAERMWARLKPQVVDLLAELLDNPPAAEPPAGGVEVTEGDMQRIRGIVARKRAREQAKRGQVH